MRRILYITAAAFALSCGNESHSTLRITNFCLPAVPDSSGCRSEATCGDSFITGGLVDLEVVGRCGNSNFIIPMEMRNLAVDSSSGPLSGNSVNSNDIFLEQLEITFASTAVTVPSGSVKVNIAGRVAPGGTSVIFAELIPRSAGDQIKSALQASPGIRQEVIVTVRASGRSHDNRSTIKSDPTKFPIQVCYGCLGFVAPACGPACAVGESLRTCPQPGQTGQSVCL